MVVGRSPALFSDDVASVAQDTALFAFGQMY
jgi:hypothetical protein